MYCMDAVLVGMKEDLASTPRIVLLRQYGFLGQAAPQLDFTGVSSRVIGQQRACRKQCAQATVQESQVALLSGPLQPATGFKQLPALGQHHRQAEHSAKITRLG
ncbi:hypothetical protein D3C72_2196220 [compost metagenome]